MEKGWVTMAKAVLLGVFDGVHLGHLKTLDALLDTGAQTKCVYTFDSKTVITKGQRKLLSTEAEKRELLISGGADEVISVDFSAVKDMTAEEVEKLRCDLLAYCAQDTMGVVKILKKFYEDAM